MAEKKEKQYVSDNVQLMAEWDWEKNREFGLEPSRLSTGTNRKVWWICRYGHHWNSTVSNRVKGSGCPYCAGRKVLIGFNDLQTVNPILSSEWNYAKNDSLKPEDFTTHSGRKVWWKCSNGHEWQATIDSRSNGYGCPFCAGQKAVSGVNDLQTINPALALEWHYEKNGDITPGDIAANCHKTVWWKCSEGHEWQAKIDNRNKGRNCPYCSGKKVLKGYNDLQTVNPTLASEWNYGKNRDLKPEFFTANSGDKVWWKCSEGHEWQSTIGNRNSGTGCPYCAGQKVLTGFNDLQTVNPVVSREWNYERNNGLTPMDVVPYSDKVVWWKDALRIIAMTDGIPALVSLFWLDISFKENVRNIFAADSLYLRYAEENLRREFRSPESYNTLLYGLAIGCNRISQLAEFSGYPKNKCDKYLKALDAAGYIETEQKKDENGQVRTHYFLKGGYLRVWYQLYFPRQQDFLDPLDEEVVKELAFWIDDCATKYYFRKLCWHWFSRNASGFYGDGSVASDNPAQHDVTVNGVPLDFIQHGKDRDLYMKIWDDPESGFPKDLFQEIEKATTTARPFYDNIYFLFSIGRVCNYVEDLRKLGTVSIVELRGFFGRNNAEHFEKL